MHKISSLVFAPLLLTLAAPAYAGGKAVCGDGVAEKKEACDGADFRGRSCESEGFSDGALTCTQSCKLDTSGCTSAPVPTCGDNIVGGHEECDGAADGACPGKCSQQCACPATAPSADLQLHMLDVGQGDGLVVVSPAGFVMLVDAGTSSNAAVVNHYLQSKGLGGIDYIVASHMDADHIGGLDGVIAAHPEVVASFDHGGSVATNEYSQYITAVADRRVTVGPGDTIDLGPGVTVEVLHGWTGSSSENDNSVVLRIAYGSNTFLLGGDCEAACEKSFIPGAIQVYKVHHHGSSTSTSAALLDAMKPWSALISAGQSNQFGHPHQSTLDALAARQVTVYGTYALGHVVVSANGTSYTVNGAPICAAGQTRSCGDSSVGACSLGARACDNGSWGSCVGAVYPTSEICDNGADDDCDGATDGDDGDCATGATHIVISQVAYDTPGTDSVEEFVDLFNPTGQVIDVSGWQLADGAGTWTIPAGTLLSAGAWLTIARDGNGLASWTGVTPDVDGMALSLNNGGDQLLLRDTQGATIDFVAWESFVSGWPVAATTGNSIARSNPYVDSDTAQDWQQLSPANPAGGTTGDGSSSGGSSGGSSSGASSCGDGVCGAGEDCTSCSSDCAGRTSGKPANRYCCGNGRCETVAETSGNCPIDCQG